MPSTPTSTSTLRLTPTIATSLVVIENRVLANRPVAAAAASRERGGCGGAFCSFSQARISLDIAAERRENSSAYAELGLGLVTLASDGQAEHLGGAGVELRMRLLACGVVGGAAQLGRGRAVEPLAERALVITGDGGDGEFAAATAQPRS